MNANECSDALGEIRGHYIEEAITYRRRGRWIPWASIAACLVLVLNLLIPTTINEITNPTVGAAAYWGGGVPLSMPQMGESDLTVESVRIDMDVQTLSHSTIDSMGTASIEMTLHNPTDETITVPITLPCGKVPHYLYIYDEDYKSLLSYPKQSQYRFTLDDTVINATHLITATETPPSEDRTQATQLIRLDSQVTKFTYRITELADCKNPRLAIWGFSHYSDYIVLLKTRYYKLLHSDSEIIVPVPIDTLPQVNDTFTAYVIGDPSDFHPVWYMVEVSTQERLGSTIVLESTETMTFLDFSNETWNEDLGISQENWAFAIAAEINPKSFLNSDNLDLTSPVHRPYHWLTYEVTLEPGQTATHRIELPLYPDYSGYGFCTYHFDLVSLRSISPTVSGTLTLTTPLTMDQTSTQWTQEDTTYRVNLSEVRDLELYFQLAIPKTIAPVDPDMGVIPSRDWISWICIAVLILLFLLARKYRKERF